MIDTVTKREFGGFAGIDLNEKSHGKPSESDNRWYQLYETMLI